jgi:methionyl-tRNA formyltransferase
MKIFLIIDESNFYHPNFVAELIRTGQHEFVGAAVVTNSILAAYLKKNWHYLKPTELIRLSLKTAELVAKDKLLPKNSGASFYSVSAVLDHFGVDYFKLEEDIHQDKYLDIIKSKAPDVIISSTSQIFRKKLLAIPKICSINRHSSLLPAYGGIWPMLHALRKGEQFVGVSIHTMEPKVDRGIILAQRKIRIEKGDTINRLYEKSFEVSTDACLEALDKIAAGQWEMVASATENTPSYYGFPTKTDWREFRQKKGRFI